MKQLYVSDEKKAYSKPWPKSLLKLAKLTILAAKLI